jgi:hypothetical protein
MSVLLFIVGAIVVMIGVGMVGYGIPINEFSFGNTLIVGGTTAVVGGLIVIAIGVAVGQLRRINQALATHTPVRPGLPVEMPEPATAAAPSRVPFPPKPKSEPVIPESQPPDETAVEDHPAVAAAPTLQNPDRPVAAGEEFKVEEYEAVSLSPRQAVRAPAPVELDEPVPVPPPVADDVFPVAGMRSEPALETPWHSSAPPPPTPERQSQPSYFDAMWPAEVRPAKRPVIDEAKLEPKPTVAPAPMPAAPSEPVAILKSGVVDGMAYTLYVDGSIEAELPQGTLHFASINELRDHLAKNS